MYVHNDNLVRVRGVGWGPSSQLTIQVGATLKGVVFTKSLNTRKKNQFFDPRLILWIITSCISE